LFSRRRSKIGTSARNFTVIREYVDLAQSGAKDSRPQLNDLLADARKRKLDAIIVWRFDRLERSTKHLVAGTRGVSVAGNSVH
jgi:DNA invertase Pin-like site-specific DNA recombinase